MKTKILVLMAFLITYGTIWSQVTSYGGLIEPGTTAGQLGSANSFFGHNAGLNTTGLSNTFMGHLSGFYNRTGTYNVFLGSTSGYRNVDGYSNTFVGDRSGENNQGGNSNTFLGKNSGYENVTGSTNTYIGRGSGYSNRSGSGNVFIGHRAGRNELSSDKLYIDNSDTDTPLIWGNFFTNHLTFNSPRVTVSGNSGSAILRLYADTDNSNESDNARIELLQDGGLGGAYFGFNASGGGSWQPDNVLRIATRYNNTVRWDALVIKPNNGYVGIGTANPDAKLSVRGGIHAQEVRVDLNGAIAPDFVFEADYDLRSLEETEAYIKANKHLPEIPSAAEMEKKGVNLKEMNLKLLQKVEELTLYAIDQNKKMENMQKEINQLKKDKK